MQNDQETPEQPGLSKAERKQQRREAKEQTHQAAQRRGVSARWVRRVVIWAGIVAVAGWVVFKVMTAPTISDENIVTRKGVHWHAQLTIRINGEEVDIPAGIGIPSGVTHPENIHTHEPDHIIHVEKPGIVTPDDLRIKNFFEIWDKRFDSECIFDSCNDGQHRVRMVVNGEERSEFENYPLQDHDVIEIMYE